MYTSPVISLHNKILSLLFLQLVLLLLCFSSTNAVKKCYASKKIRSVNNRSIEFIIANPVFLYNDVIMQFQTNSTNMVYINVCLDRVHRRTQYQAEKSSLSQLQSSFEIAATQNPLFCSGTSVLLCQLCFMKIKGYESCFLWLPWLLVLHVSSQQC